jgi:probable rRNA maturation factor
VLAAEGRPAASVGLRLTGDADLREMNRAWRGLDRPTDVLAFPADPSPGEDYLGDIALSVERAAAQAPRFGATLEAELARLVIHGLLHLLGYDHHTPADGRRMRARERLHLESVSTGSILPPC